MMNNESLNINSIYLVIEYQGNSEKIVAVGDKATNCLPLITTDKKMALQLFDKMVSVEKTKNFKLLQFSSREELRDY